MALQQYASKVVEELGLRSIYNSPVDTKLLYIQRFVRLFAYGGSTIILVLYLRALEISETEIGLFMTLTLFGDVIISFFLTLFADALGRRTILMAGAALMSASGVVFALSANYWILLAAAIFGVISPNGNEIGPFRAIEESTLAHLSPAEIRSDIYAWYSLIGSAGAACGMITCGWVVRHLKSLDGWTTVRAYRMIFYAYAALGLIKFALAAALSKNIEAEKGVPNDPEQEVEGEQEPLLGNGNAPPKAPKHTLSSMLPNISAESRVIVLNLCLLFALDSFGSGLVPLSWTTYFFNYKFGLPEEKLGSLFFTTSIIAAASTLVASSLSKRIGNIKTMVFTHLPSSIFLALIPVPATIGPAMLFLILRSCTQSMDTAPRSAFLAAVILPHERTAIMGALNVVKTFSSSIGPGIAGVLVHKELFWVCFVMAGALKATYDLGILAVFAGHVSREDKAKLQREAESAAASGGEEDDAERTV